MKLFLLFNLLICANVAYSKNIRMVQVDKTFYGDISDKEAEDAFDNLEFEKEHKVEKIQAKVGDTIQFINRDEVAHNVSGTLESKFNFDVKLQEPGAKNDRSIPLTKKGEILIQCAIHPKMKFKLVVD